MIQLCYIKTFLHSFYYFRLRMRYTKFLKHCIHCCHKLENYWIWFAQSIDLRHRLLNVRDDLSVEVRYKRCTLRLLSISVLLTNK